MLDQFIAVAYANETKKTAEAAVMAKLHTMPDAVVEKIAFGGLSAACGSPKSIDDPKTWLDMFQGTPLFDKALELERADLQLEQQDIERRMNEQASDTWTKRDALRLQKRMLELDLAMENAGGAAEPEVKEEEGVQMLEQAQAEETAAGEGGEPHEQKEDAAIDQFRAAQAEEAAAKPKVPPKPKAEAAPPQPPMAAKEAGLRDAAKRSAELITGSKARELKTTAQHGAQGYNAEKAKVLATRFGTATAGGIGTGLALRHAVGEKEAAEIKVAAATAAGRLMAKLAEPPPPKGKTAKEWDKELQKKEASEDSSLAHVARGVANEAHRVLKGKADGLRDTVGVLSGSNKEAGVGGALMGAATGAKNLIGTAYKAGGLGGVAKSVGNVATGFAKANPLAAAGAAGVAGLAAGRLSKSNAPQA